MAFAKSRFLDCFEQYVTFLQNSRREHNLHTYGLLLTYLPNAFLTSLHVSEVQGETSWRRHVGQGFKKWGRKKVT